MSDQRRYRQELRQGFHQFAMGMYHSYLETHTPKEAEAFVIEAINEQLRLFMADEPSFGESVTETINQKIKEFQDQVTKTSNFDEQMRLSEKIDTLKNALEILS